MARGDNAATPTGAPTGRIAQIRQTFTMTRRADPALPYVLAAFFVGVLAVFIVVGILLGLVWLFIIPGILGGLIAVLIVFGRRAERAAYASIEGQPGAAAAVLQSMRGQWFVHTAVAVSKNQDVVHRIVGRPGVILISEGPSTRVSNMLANEKRRTARFVSEIPMHEIQCGSEDGQVPLKKLQRTVQKLPRTLRPGQVTDLRRRLEALAQGPALPVPKGPLPKNARMPKGPRG